MRKLVMENVVPEVNGGRCVSVKMNDNYSLEKFEIKENETSIISESDLECKIDPSTFVGEWLEHQPTTTRQEETLMLYQDAKAKGRLHAFTCMTIDATVENGKVVYQKDLTIKTGFSKKEWAKMLKDYNPSRNSRQMTRTEWVCRNLFIIQKLVESGYEIDEAWEAVCDDSKGIGHYIDSDNSKDDFEVTGSREVCGFCDLGNVWKLLARDPWEEAGGFWVVGELFDLCGWNAPVADLSHWIDEDTELWGCVGMIAFD